LSGIPNWSPRRSGRGLVSTEAAREEYGVIVGDDGTVDRAATEEARETGRDERDDLEEFDYGPLPEEGELADRIAAERREFDDRHN